MGHWGWRSSVPEQVFTKSCQCKQAVPFVLPELHGLFRGVSAELRRPYYSFETIGVYGDWPYASSYAGEQGHCGE